MLNIGMWAQDARPGSSAGKPCAEYVCYLCNEQFDSQTLQMHVPACQKRWENEQLKLNPSLRKPLPPVPAEMKKGAEGLPTVTIEVQAFNSKMEDIYTEHALSRCNTCKCNVRTDRLQAHLLVCSAVSPSVPIATHNGRHSGRFVGSSGKQYNLPPSTGISSAGQSSNACQHRFSYACFLCGRDFGSRSLGIHMPQCLKKWEVTEALLPLDEQRAHPRVPQELADPSNPGRILHFKDGAAEGILPTDPKEVESFNRAMVELSKKNWQHVQAQPATPMKSFSPASSLGGSNTFPLGFPPPAVHEQSSDSLAKKDSALARLAKFAFGGNMPSFARRSSENGMAALSSGGEKIAKAYVCYLCGQQFGARSLGIHLHHCNRQRELQNLKLPHPRPPLPLPPKVLADADNPVRLCSYQDGVIPDGVLPTTEAEIRAFNTAMTEYWRAGLPKCLYCKTVFLPEQLPEHQPSCSAAPRKAKAELPASDPKPGPSTSSSGPKQKAQPLAMFKPVPSQAKPQARHSTRSSRLLQAQAILKVGGFRHYRCYLCEEKFPGTVLKAHCMDCKRTWVKAEEVLPDGMRRLLPPPPPEMRLILTGQAELPVDPSDVAAFNAAMAAHWEASSLLRCAVCKGCFRPSTYMKLHHSACVLSTSASDDTTISMGSHCQAVLTPPITREVGRPVVVPALPLSESGAKQSTRQSQQPHAHKAAHGGKSTKAAQAENNAVKSTLMQAAAALQAASEGRAGKPPPTIAARDLQASKGRKKSAAATPVAASRASSALGRPISTNSSPACGAEAKTRAIGDSEAGKAKSSSRARDRAGGQAGKAECKASAAKPSKPISSRPSQSALATPVKAQGAPVQKPGYAKSPGQATRAATGLEATPTKDQDSTCQHMDRAAPACQLNTWSTVSSLHSGHALQSSHMYSCYLCGQHYHYHSYYMHIGQCTRKWEKEQASVQNPAERASLPPAPSMLSGHGPLPTDSHAVASFNEEMHKHREMYAMRRCDECSKNVSSLMWSRHKLHCKSSCAPKSTQEKAAASHKAGPAARGRLSYTCYVCSRSFNASNYPGHVEACRVSFEKKDAALREKLPAHFQTPCRLPNPAPDHKRLPVQPELVDAYNQRMLDTYTIIQTSLKLSLPPTDCGQLETQEGHRPPMVRSPAPTAKDVLSEFMGLRGSRLSSGNTTPGRDSDAFELFTPLPTGPGMQKGEVLVSCRHCGKAISESELFIHVPQCASGSDGCAKTGSQPPTHRSSRTSNRTYRAAQGGEPMVLLRSQRDARRTYDDLLGPQASPPAPTIAEAALDGSSHGQPEAQPEAASRAEEPVVHAKGRNMARKMNKLVEAARAKIFAPFSAFGSRLRRKLHLKKGSRANDTVTNSSKWHLPE